jgi:MOSC domain-containing protein YiiM
MNLQLISVNVGQEQSIAAAKVSGKTGIYKLPASGPVQISKTGLAGDAICDIENHGGLDQAVYIYGAPDYAWWSEALGRDLSPGTFGENLTISGLESAAFWIGDRLQVGSASHPVEGPVTLEVTSPRIPCVTLAARMDDSVFIKRFRTAERPGLYCRVIQAGWVQPGDPVIVERYAGETLSAIEMFRAFFESELNEAAIRRQLAAPIAVRARVEMEAQLKKVLAKKQLDAS